MPCPAEAGAAPVFRAGRSAHETHRSLLCALDALKRAEENALLYFAEILRRRLYRKLGYSSIHQYASEALGFSPSKTSQFIRLAESLDALILAGLEALLREEPCEIFAASSEATNSTKKSANFTRVKSAPKSAAAQGAYQIIILRNADTKKATIQVGRREVAINEATFQRIACDARVLEPGQRNKATIPPALRRAVLARDAYRCTAPGCGPTRSREIHHVNPRERGGGNEPENLVTLCSACHQLLHERGLAVREGRPRYGSVRSLQSVEESAGILGCARKSSGWRLPCKAMGGSTSRVAKKKGT